MSTNTQPALNPTDDEEKKISGFLLGKKSMEFIARQISGNIDTAAYLSNMIMDINRSPALQKCTRPSMLQCAVDAMNFGLIPSKALGHAYLVPSKNKVGNQYVDEMQLRIGYKGYVKKFSENGLNVEVELVTKEEIAQDRFYETRGSNPSVRHDPVRSGLRTPDNVSLGYIVGRKKGMHDLIVVMSIEEILEAGLTNAYDYDLKRKVTKHRNLWVGETNIRKTDWAEMCKKTLIRRLSKITDIDSVNRISNYEGVRDDSRYAGEMIKTQPTVTPFDRFKQKDITLPPPAEPQEPAATIVGIGPAAPGSEKCFIGGKIQETNPTQEGV